MVENFYKKLDLNASIHALPRNLQTLLETVYHLNKTLVVKKTALFDLFSISCWLAFSSLACC